jgi:type II secretory pathway component GspD/PulD (secretin)
MKTTDAAVVTAGAKVMVGQKNKAESKSTTQRSIVSGPTDQKVVRLKYVNVGTQFTAAAEVRRDDKIFVELEFEHSAIEEGDGKTDRGVIVERQWTSSVYVQAGKPTLVGATQDKETGTFLIVTATIQE